MKLEFQGVSHDGSTLGDGQLLAYFNRDLTLEERRDLHTVLAAFAACQNDVQATSGNNRGRPKPRQFFSAEHEALVRAAHTDGLRYAKGQK